MPPRTADGIATRAAANFEKTPMVIKKKLEPMSTTTGTESLEIFRTTI